MARNILGADCIVVTRTAPSGGVTSGLPFLLGSECLIPLSSVAAGVDVACVIKGRVHLPIKSGETWATQGIKVYWNATNSECEDTDSADNYLIGTYGGAFSATRAVVEFDGEMLAAGGEDLDQKSDKAVPAAAHNLAGLTAGGNLEDSGIPAPGAGDTAKFLRGDKSWQTVSADGALPTTGGTMTGAIVLEKGTATATGESVTLNKQSGVITTKSLNTAASSTYALTVVNSRCVGADTPVAVTQIGGTNTKWASILKCVPGTGEFVVTFKNMEDADALDGTEKFSFVVG